MNNLKRVFSLALAGAMLAGMMVMGASAADFTDADKIVNTEAVDVAVALSIINGKDDGSYFDPEGLVTRGEMAKMIAVAVNGGKEPNMGVKATATYTDIKGHWAEQYIEYCSDMKYINGRGDGTFDPAGNVTGVEAAKMVLTALGYDAKAYQLTGADWAINTNFIATRTCDTSLYESMNGVNMNNPLSRDNAAQVIWNGLQNYVVEYNPNVTITGGEVTNQYKKSASTKLLKQAYDANILEDAFVGNSKFNKSGIKAGQIKVGGDVFPADLSIDYIGEEVRVVYKDGKGGRSNHADDKDAILGVFVTGNTDVLKGTLAQFDDCKAGLKERKVNFDGVDYDVAANFKLYDNFGANVVVDAYSQKADTNSALTDRLKKTSGATVKMTFNDDGEINNIYVTESQLARVTAINSTKVTLGKLGAITIADNDIYDGIKKGDMVEVTTYYAASPTADGAYSVVKKAESITGTVELYKNDKETTYSTSVTVDGKSYKVAVQGYVSGNTKMSDAVVDGVEKFEGENLNEEFELYLIGGMVVGAVQLSESNSNYSLVISKNAGENDGGSNKVGVAIDGAKAEVLLSDGTKTVLTLNDDSYDYVNKQDITDASYYKAGDIVTYSIDKSGYAALELRAVSAKGNVSYKSTTKEVVINTKSYTAAADCVVYMTTSSGAGYKAYDLRSLKTFSVTNKDYAAVINADDGVVKALYVDNGARPAGATSSTVYGIVSAYNGQVKVDGTAYRSLTVQSEGETYTAYIGKDRTENKGDIVKMELSSDNVYGKDDFVKIDSTWIGKPANTAFAGYVKSYNEKDNTVTVGEAYTLAKDSKTYTVGGTIGTYAITKDTVIYYVDRENSVAIESAGITAMDAIEHTANIIIIVDKDDKNGSEASVIIFETSNDKDIVAGVSKKV